jgi:hypothetical protein
MVKGRERRFIVWQRHATRRDKVINSRCLHEGWSLNPLWLHLNFICKDAYFQIMSHSRVLSGHELLGNTIESTIYIT